RPRATSRSPRATATAAAGAWPTPRSRKSAWSPRSTSTCADAKRARAVAGADPRSVEARGLEREAERAHHGVVCDAVERRPGRAFDAGVAHAERQPVEHGR